MPRGGRIKCSVPTVKKPRFPCRAVTPGFWAEASFLSSWFYIPTILSIILFELRESPGMRIQPLLSQVRGPQGDKWDLTSCPATTMNSPRRCPLWFTEHSAVLTFMSSASLRQAVWLSGTGSRALGSNPALVVCWPLRPERFCKHAVVMTAATQAAGLTLSVSS